MRLGAAVHIPGGNVISVVAPVREDTPVEPYYGGRTDRTAANVALAVELPYGIRLGAAIGVTANLVAPTAVGFDARRGDDVDAGVVIDQDRDLTLDASLVIGARWQVIDELAFGLVWRQGGATRASGTFDIMAGAIVVTDEYNFYDLLAPEEVALGACVTPIRELSLSLDLTWGRWSEYRTIHDERPSLAFSDVLDVRAAAEWTAHESLRVRLGYAFLPSPVPEQRARDNFLDAHRHEIAFGLGLDLEPLARFPMRVDLALRFHAQHEQVATKDRALLPDASTSAGQTIDNLGYPGFRSRGSFAQVSLALTIALDGAPGARPQEDAEDEPEGERADEDAPSEDAPEEAPRRGRARRAARRRGRLLGGAAERRALATRARRGGWIMSRERSRVGSRGDRGERALSRCAAALTALVVVTSASARADVEGDLGLGARASALGGAVSAIGGDYAAANYNPGALVVPGDRSGLAEVGFSLLLAAPSLWVESLGEEPIDVTPVESTYGLTAGARFDIGAAFGAPGLVLGLAVYTPFGGLVQSVIRPDDAPQWAMLTDRTQHITLYAGLAYRIAEWLSVGVGVRILFDEETFITGRADDVRRVRDPETGEDRIEAGARLGVRSAIYGRTSPTVGLPRRAHAHPPLRLRVARPPLLGRLGLQPPRRPRQRRRDRLPAPLRPHLPPRRARLVGGVRADRRARDQRRAHLGHVVRTRRAPRGRAWRAASATS
ncbi:MAG: hypothetical protein M5U28_28770 [Sandaracinaceae bacterium]|nr:hypothetical protein [Sandaracinaceae bacterium]